MFTETLRSPGSRLLTAALCVAGLAAISMAANAADRPNCEPITKACNNPLIVPRQAATREKPPAASATDAATRASTRPDTSAKRHRCEPITKVCIYKSDANTAATTPTVTPTVQSQEPSAPSKRQRCEPPTKVCIYR